ncbi:MAG: hypothetical protein FJY97_03845, partial [candidate division Zixibacteria bacterium]|nr:hypothetical protein [candidate division Zixibacteria bacterium]
MLGVGGLSAVGEGRTARFPGFDAGLSSASGANFLELVFEKNATAAFVTACRRAGTSLHAGLGAIQLLTVNGEFPDTKQHRLGLVSTIDLRKKVIPRTPDRMPGVYFSMIRTTHAVAPGFAPWPLARDIDRQLAESVGRGHGHLVWLGLGRIARLGPAAFRYLSNRLPPSTLLSHIGNTPVGPVSGDIRVLSFSMTVCPLPMTPIVTVTNVFEGRLFA